MSSASSMCQTYPAYTSDAPEDVSTALHGSGEGSLCTQVHASCGSTLYSTNQACNPHAIYVLQSDNTVLRRNTVSVKLKRKAVV